MADILEQIRENYSGNVQLQLRMKGTIVPLSKIGPGYVVLSEPAEFPRGFGQILMSVDGREQTWDVRVPHGAVPFDGTVEVRCS